MLRSVRRLLNMIALLSNMGSIKGVPLVKGSGMDLRFALVGHVSGLKTICNVRMPIRNLPKDSKFFK